MRFRIGLALSISILLILGSFFYRRITLARAPVGLVSTETAPDPIADLPSALPDTNSYETTSTKEDLSTTDLIGRQLISSYLDLAATGQATNQNITALANQYADQIPSLSSGEKIDLRDIKVVADTNENLRAYADSLMAIYKEARARTNASVMQSSSVSLLSPDFLPTAKVLSEAYATGGRRLASIPVPQSLVLAHISLTNNFFGNAAALETLSKVDSDPAMALSGLLNLSANIKNETPLLTQIIAVLNQHGI